MGDHLIRVAMIGQKGYPPVHGGIERHVAELAARLAAGGVAVDLFSRPHYSSFSGETGIPGLRVVRRPSIPTKHLDAATGSLIATLEALARRYDILHFHALGPGLFAGLARLCRRPSVVTVHGLDWQREKWGPLARRVLRWGEHASARWPSRTIVVSRALQRHYRDRYGAATDLIPNGITPPAAPPAPDVLERAGLPAEFVLFVGRLVPEKGCHVLLEAHRALPQALRERFPLVVAGDDVFGGEYVHGLQSVRDEHVRWLGFVHGELLEALYAAAALVVLPSTLEGLSIALLEAMSRGRACLVSDIPPNREAGGEAVSYVPPGDAGRLVRAMAQLLAADAASRAEMGRRAAARVLAGYSWDRAAAATRQVYRELVGR